MFNFHEQRSSLFNELHNRPFPVITTPARVSQLSLIRDVDNPNFVSIEYKHLCELCARYSVNPPQEGASCYYEDLGGFEFRWERHSEFSTYTFIHHLSGEPFTKTALTLLPNEWLARLPGKVINGLHIDIEAMPEEQPKVESLRNYFEGHRLLSCFVRERSAQVWTAYKIHSDNMGRFLVFNQSLNPCQTGRLVRRILEMETYRMMALLSLPLAKQIAPDISKTNLKLASIIQEIKLITTLEDERRLMAALTSLSSEVAQFISETNYRFSATQAYYRLVMSRLEELRESEVCGLQTLSEFLERRLTPAYLTCQTIEQDLEDIAQRIDRATELLRTRINLTIESQNQELLKSLNRRGQLQLRAQQAVEGLSVVAISYYLLGLVKYASEFAKAQGVISSTATVVGISIPVVIGMVVLGVRRLKKHLLEEH